MDIKISRPLSAPGSPRERSGMMTPGDFASLQEGREGLSTEDYIAWKLPEEEEEADVYPFPLTLKSRRGSLAGSAEGAAPNGTAGVNGGGGSGGVGALGKDMSSMTLQQGGHTTAAAGMHGVGNASL